MQEIVTSYLRHLADARHLSPRTRVLYADHAQRLSDALARDDVRDVTRADIEGYMAELTEQTSAANAAVHYRSIQQFFRWCVEEEEIAVSPMMRVRPPKPREVPVPVIERDGLLRLLATRTGKDFYSRRDFAILCLLMDTGMRRAELLGMRWNPQEPSAHDVDLHQRIIRVVGKGNRERLVPIGTKSVTALDRYERARSRYPSSALPWYWLGRKGRMQVSGLYRLIHRACKQAGIPPIHPHQFRHTFASTWLESGAQEGDLMRVAGWRSRTMLNRYGAAAADARARKAHATYSPLDNL